MSLPVLSLKNVTIAQEGKIILSNVNLEVKHGEFIYIIGKTGSGKSSFMKALYADLPLAEGEGTIVDFDPIDFISSSSSSRALIVLATSINSTPFFAKDFATDRPNPLDAPVIRAILFFISFCMFR